MFSPVIWRGGFRRGEISEAPTSFVTLQFLCLQLSGLECEQLLSPWLSQYWHLLRAQQRHIEIFDVNPHVGLQVIRAKAPSYVSFGECPLPKPWVSPSPAERDLPPSVCLVHSMCPINGRYFINNYIFTTPHPHPRTIIGSVFLIHSLYGTWNLNFILNPGNQKKWATQCQLLAVTAWLLSKVKILTLPKLMDCKD